jgi:hypothetical protein
MCNGDNLGYNLGCSLGIGGKCGVSSVVFWFLAGIFSWNVAFAMTTIE